MSDKLTRADIVNLVNEFTSQHGLDPWEVAISYGAAMVMHELRYETSDIDLDVSVQDYRELSHDYSEGIKQGLIGACCDVSQFISIHGRAFTRDDVMMIDGVQCYTLKKVLEHKLAMQAHPNRHSHKRRADARDITALQNAISG